MWTHPALAPPGLYHLHSLQEAHPSSGLPPVGQLLVLPFPKAQSQYLGPWSDLYDDPEGGEVCTKETHPLGSSFYLPCPLDGLLSELSGQRCASLADASEFPWLKVELSTVRAHMCRNWRPRAQAFPHHQQGPGRERECRPTCQVSKCLKVINKSPNRYIKICSILLPQHVCLHNDKTTKHFYL